MIESKRLLLVEDSPSIRSMLTDFFSTHGFRVDAVADGQAGYDKAQVGGYHVIILDLKMPRKDGLQFLQDLQLHPPQHVNGPMIVYSSAGYDYARKEALKLGAAAFISKDETDPVALLQHIHQLTSQFQG